MSIIRIAIVASLTTGWNSLTTPTSTGTKVASGSVVDSTNTVVPGVAIAVQARFDTIFADGTDMDSYPTDVEASSASAEIGNNDNAIVRLTGLGACTAIVTAYGNAPGSTPGDRTTTVTVTAQSGSTTNGTYDAINGAGNEASRTYTSSGVNVGASDYLDIQISDVSGGSASRCNAILVNFTASDTLMGQACL